MSARMPRYLLLPRLLRGNLRQNIGDLLAGRAAGLFVAFIGQQRGAVRQRAHAHHEEFFQIGAVNAEKLEPFKERYGLVARFFEHA